MKQEESVVLIVELPDPDACTIKLDNVSITRYIKLLLFLLIR